MRNISPFVRNLGILALIAVVIVVANLETTLSTIGLLVRFAFVIAIAVVIYMLWRDFGRREISIWPARAQWIVYGSAAVVVVDLGWWFLTSVSGPNALVFFVSLAAAAYCGVRTWRRQTTYS